MYKKLLLLSLLGSGALIASAQTDSTKKEVDYKPQIEGIVKVKFEQSLYSGDARFNVRNSRFGLRGNVSENMNYRMQVEFNNEGKISVLDAYAAYQLPIVSFSLGQQRYAFSTDLGRSPAHNIFANRTFVAKYITTYIDTTGTIVRTLGSRDIGGLFTVNLDRWVPMALKFGVFNGDGINNPNWQDHLNVSLRAEYGKKEGLQAAASYYFGDTPYKQQIHMWNGELRYVNKKFTIDSEVAQRTFEQNGSHTLTAMFVQGFYAFDLKPNIFAKYIAPTLRYDYMKNSIYEGVSQDFNAQRVSMGINFGMTPKLFKGEFRINFEKYILSQSPAAIYIGELLHDKFTLEMVVSF